MIYYLLTIKYDGYNYFGWSKQKNQKTIQGEIEKALYKLSNKPIWTLGSSRTDKQVHAIDQKCLVKIPFLISKNNLKRHLNGHLPEDIFVFNIKEIDSNFNIRQTKNKIYKYNLIYKRDVFKIKTHFLFNSNINEKSINEACQLFIGKYNFFNFCKNKKEENINFNREIKILKFIQYKNKGTFIIEGSSFMRHQIRMIIGTILAYNDKKINLEYIKDKLKNITTNNNKTRYIVPGNGLLLYKIKFNK